MVLGTGHQNFRRQRCEFCSDLHKGKLTLQRFTHTNPSYQSASANCGNAQSNVLYYLEFLYGKICSTSLSRTHVLSVHLRDEKKNTQETRKNQISLCQTSKQLYKRKYG